MQKKSAGAKEGTAVKLAAPDTDKARRGRPRSTDANERILRAAHSLVMERGYSELTMEAVALRAGVGKPTVYLRWPTKARLVLDAVLLVMDKRIGFPKKGSLRDSLFVQMKRVAKLMNSAEGKIIATIIGGGQTDPELLEAYRENWWAPRRAGARRALNQAIERNELDNDVDIDFVIDALYSPLFYRLLVRHAPLNDKLLLMIIDTVLGGLAASSGRDLSTKMDRWS